MPLSLLVRLHHVSSGRLPVKSRPRAGLVESDPFEHRSRLVGGHDHRLDGHLLSAGDLCWGVEKSIENWLVAVELGYVNGVVSHIKREEAADRRLRVGISDRNANRPIVDQVRHDRLGPAGRRREGFDVGLDRVANVNPTCTPCFCLNMMPLQSTEEYSFI